MSGRWRWAWSSSGRVLMKAGYGIDRTRFVAPTRIGDTVHVQTEVLAIEPREDGSGVVTSKFVVGNQRGEDVLVGRLGSLVAGKPAGA
jgi:acyl dehydratase